MAQINLDDPMIRLILEKTGLMHLAHDPAALEAELDRRLEEQIRKQQQEYESMQSESAEDS